MKKLIILSVAIVAAAFSGTQLANAATVSFTNGVPISYVGQINAKANGITLKEESWHGANLTALSFRRPTESDVSGILIDHPNPWIISVRQWDHSSGETFMDEFPITSTLSDSFLVLFLEESAIFWAVTAFGMPAKDFDSLNPDSQLEAIRDMTNASQLINIRTLPIFASGNFSYYQEVLPSNSNSTLQSGYSQVFAIEDEHDSDYGSLLINAYTTSYWNRTSSKNSTFWTAGKKEISMIARMSPAHYIIEGVGYLRILESLSIMTVENYYDIHGWRGVFHIKFSFDMEPTTNRSSSSSSNTYLYGYKSAVGTLAVMGAGALRIRKSKSRKPDRQSNLST